MLLAGHKVLGSAQRRRRGAVLQHGSLLLQRSPHAPDLFGLIDLCPDRPLPADLAFRLAHAIAARLSDAPKEGSLVDEELTLAHRLRTQRYTARRWTEKYKKRP